jgi:hypothetical protein
VQTRDNERQVTEGVGERDEVHPSRFDILTSSTTTFPSTTPTTAVALS